MNYLNKLFRNLTLILITFIMFSCSMGMTGTGDTDNGAVISVGNSSVLAVEVANGLNRSCIDSESVDTESINSDSVIVVDMSQDLTNEDYELIDTANRKDASFVLKNTSNDKMKGFAMITAEADTVLVFNNIEGRTQKIIIEGDKDNLTNLPMEEDELEPVVNEPNGSNSNGLNMEIESGMEPAGKMKEALNSYDIVSMIKDQLSKKAASRSVSSENINASLAKITVIFSERHWNPDDSEASYFGSFDVEISATTTPEKKFVKINSVGTGVRIGNMINNGKYGRKWFTNYGRVIYFPGSSYTYNNNNVAIPSGWRRIHNEPLTINAKTTYVSTTGWSVGAEGGGEVAESPKAAMKLSASYSESEQERREVPDFQVKNQSSGTVCDWRYEYTKLNDNWGGMFSDDLFKKGTVNGLVPLATGTMFMHNEAVYEAPSTTSGQQPFIFVIEHGASNLYVTGDWLSYTKKMQTKAAYTTYKVNINFDLVKPPGENGLEGDYAIFTGYTEPTPLFTQKDNKIDFDWTTTPHDSRLTGDMVVINWSGFLKAPYTGEYKLYTYNNDSVSIFFDGDQLLSSWYYANPREHVVTAYMLAGQYYPIKLRYAGRKTNSKFTFSWEHSSITKQIVPWEYLYSGRYW